MKLETYLSALRKTERMRQIAIWFNEPGLIAKRICQGDKFAAKVIEKADRIAYDKYWNGYNDGMAKPDF